MSTYMIVCTRDAPPTETLKSLISYIDRSAITLKLVKGAKSIFSGYQNAFNELNPQDNDIIILCHDDIQILTDSVYLEQILYDTLFPITLTADFSPGFVGVAGTTEVGTDLTWWNHQKWAQGKHRGFVYHGDSLSNLHSTYYGDNGRVVVLDGVFLAASKQVLELIGLSKPDYLKENWDFYDLHYTYSAHKLGLKNYTVPITILHNSPGELVGRNSWHNNRKGFLLKWMKDFPLTI